MTDLDHIALEFCRECLGWEKPYAGYQNTPATPFVCGGGGERLWTADLKSVMGTVRKWRDQTQDALDEYVTVTLSCTAGEYIGHAFVGTGQPSTATSSDPCHALLAACVEASRKLKGSGA